MAFSFLSQINIWQNRNSNNSSFHFSCTYTQRPSRLEGYTKPIADNGGHLLGGVQRSSKCPWGGFVGTWDSRDNKSKPHHQPTGVRGKLKCDDGAEILTLHSPAPPQSAGKENVEKPLSPIPQPFDEKDVGISKHIKDVRKTEAVEANKLPSPSPPPRTAERTPSPVGSNARVDVQPE